MGRWGNCVRMDLAAVGIHRTTRLTSLFVPRQPFESDPGSQAHWRSRMPAVRRPPWAAAACSGVPMPSTSRLTFAPRCSSSCASVQIFAGKKSKISPAWQTPVGDRGMCAQLQGPAPHRTLTHSACPAAAAPCSKPPRRCAVSTASGFPPESSHSASGPSAPAQEGEAEQAVAGGSRACARRQAAAVLRRRGSGRPASGDSNEHMITISGRCSRCGRRKPGWGTADLLGTPSRGRRPLY